MPCPLGEGIGEEPIINLSSTERDDGPTTLVQRRRETSSALERVHRYRVHPATGAAPSAR